MQQYLEGKIEMSFLNHLQLAAMVLPERLFKFYALFNLGFSCSFNSNDKI